MSKALDQATFLAIKQQRRMGRSPKQVANAKHVSLATIERIDNAASFGDYQGNSSARYEAVRRRQRAQQRKFNKPLEGTSIDNMKETYTPPAAAPVEPIEYRKAPMIGAIIFAIVVVAVIIMVLV